MKNNRKINMKKWFKKELNLHGWKKGIKTF